MLHSSPDPGVDIVINALIIAGSIGVLAVVALMLAKFLVIAPPAPLEYAYAYLRPRPMAEPGHRRGVSHRPDAVRLRLASACTAFASADTAIMMRDFGERYSAAASHIG